MALKATILKAASTNTKDPIVQTYSKLRRTARTSAQGESRSRVPPTKRNSK